MSALGEHASKSRSLVLLCFGLFVAVVALSTYIAYDHITKKDSVKEAETRDEVLYVYGDFFKTGKQQHDYEQQLARDINQTEIQKEPKILQVCNFTEPLTTAQTPSPSSTTNAPTTPSVFSWASFPPSGEDGVNVPPPSSELEGINTPPPSFRSRRSPGVRNKYFESPRYHGCCMSRRYFTSPSSGTNEDDGQTVILVQYKSHRQYFLTQDCSHDFSCVLQCGCRQQMGIYRALVYNPDSTSPAFVVRNILIPGGCKCLNGLKPPPM